jgi:hypothetical protein
MCSGEISASHTHTAMLMNVRIDITNATSVGERVVRTRPSIEVTQSYTQRELTPAPGANVSIQGWR